MDNEIKKILDDAIIVVSGYAFSKCKLGYRIFSSRTKNAIVLSEKGEMLETSMDEIEQEIAKKYFEENKEFLEDEE